MTAVVSTNKSMLSPIDAYTTLYDFQGAQFSLEALRRVNPFLFFSNVLETTRSHVTVSETFASDLQDIDPRSLLLTPSSRPEQNRSVKIIQSSAAEFKTEAEMYASDLTESGAMSYLSSIVDSISAAIYKHINHKCQAAINGNVTISDIIIPGSASVEVGPDADSVTTLDATTTGFDLATSAKIRVAFAAQTQNNFVNSDDYYLILPEAARAKFLESAGGIQAVSYSDDLKLMPSVEIIRGSPVYSPKGNFFKKTSVKIGSTTKDCVLGYAVLKRGLTIGYQAKYFGDSGFRNSSRMPVSPERVSNISNAMYSISLREMPSTYHKGYVVAVEGNIGVLRSFSGSVVRIALPVDNL